MRRVCVFCGSNAGRNPRFAQRARELGALLAREQLGLVYGGGGVGLMGQLASAAMEAGGEVIGVIPDALQARELGHTSVTDLRVVGTMHERKALMATLADGFIAMPGGMGTLDELCEIVTWAQLGIHTKPCAVLNVDRYFDPFLAFLDGAVAEKLIAPAHRSVLLVDDEPERLLKRMREHRPVAVTRWAAPRDV